MNAHRYLRKHLTPAPATETDGTARVDSAQKLDDVGKNKHVEGVAKSARRGRNKKRPRDSNDEERMCLAVLRGSVCAYSTCKYGHDISDYLKRRAKDLGDVCVNYAGEILLLTSMCVYYVKSDVECLF